MNYFSFGGITVALGNNIPDTDRTKYRWTIFGEDDKTRLIPESEWDALIDQFDYANPGLSTLSYVHDQDGIGMCNASATASAIETAHMRAGDKFVALSAGDLYNRICGGQDQGSLLEDGLEESKNGIATVEECPYLEWRRRSQGNTRKFHRVLEWYLAPTFAHCMSGVLQGFDLISGIMWYDSYKQLTSEGWLPAPGGRPGGHAVHGYKPAKRSGSSRGGKYGIWHKNSWTQRFGINGHCVFPQGAYQGNVGGWWLTRVVTSSHDDKLPTPAFN